MCSLEIQITSSLYKDPGLSMLALAGAEGGKGVGVEVIQSWERRVVRYPLLWKLRDGFFSEKGFADRLKDLPSEVDRSEEVDGVRLKPIMAGQACGRKPIRVCLAEPDGRTHLGGGGVAEEEAGAVVGNLEDWLGHFYKRKESDIRVR